MLPMKINIKMPENISFIYLIDRRLTIYVHQKQESHQQFTQPHFELRYENMLINTWHIVWFFKNKNHKIMTNDEKVSE